jgi:23S rRNA (guanosine2251-2'-O)-methyltransferase
MFYNDNNQKQSETIIYGRHPILDAVAAGTPIHKILFQEGVRGELEKEIRHLCRDHDIPLQVVPKERLNKFVRGNHQGLIAFISLKEYNKIEDILPMIYDSGETPLILLLDGITDVRNFGAIARSAEVCGAQVIVVPSKSSAHINEDAMKTSAGALAKIPVCRESSLVTVIEYLQGAGVTVIASDLQGRAQLPDVDMKRPLAIVIGSEGEGVSQGVLRKVDQRFIIPQKGTTDSFNVSVATGIILYEVMRQRG